MRHLPLLVMLSATPVAAADATSVCQELIAASGRLSGGSPLKVGSTATTYKSLYDECDRQNTFAGNRLPIHNGRRMTCRDQNRVAYLNTFPDGTVSFNAKAAVDSDGSKFACGAGWPNQCRTWLQFDRGSQRRDIDAEESPFVVVPGKLGNINFLRDTRIGQGDLAVAFTADRCSFGLVGDSGPHFRLGEISLRSHRDLGHDRCRNAGERPCTAVIESGIGSGVRYLIFPRTRPRPLTSQTVTRAEALAVDRTDAFLKSLR